MPTKINRKKIDILVTVDLMEVQAGEKAPDLTAYAFSPGGKLLAREKVSGGKVELSVDPTEKASGVRVVVGPDEGKNVTFATLERRGAAETMLRLEPGQFELRAPFDIARADWLCWLRGWCSTKGTVLKRRVLDGIAIDLPVCNATVEVYEVDPKLILKLPDYYIERIRDFIIDPGPLRIPQVIPDPPPDVIRGGFGPGPRPAGKARHAEADAASAAAIATSSLRSSADFGGLAALARSAHVEQLRQSLAGIPGIARYFCHLFPANVTMQLVATAVTDDCGKFRARFWLGCNSDTPDLYFRVKQNLFFPLTIYSPTPVACYTRWNYACGSEVTIHVTHPLAMTCPPCPNVDTNEENWVLFMAMGNHPLSRIRGTATDPAIQAGTNPTNLGLTSSDAPWGGLLRPRLEFDSSLLASGKATHYRISWKKQGDPDTAYQPLTAADGTVNRHYIHKEGTKFIIDPYELGPKTVGTTANLFEIPPALPPKGQWSIPDAVEDTANAKFPTTNYVTRIGQIGGDQAGKYQLKVELFKHDGVGNVTKVNSGITYLVPSSLDLSGVIETSRASDLGLVTGGDMIVTLHIDNNVCSASIGAPHIGATAADDACGVLEYSPGNSVDMPYSASHPHGFATFSFAVVRGAGSWSDSVSGTVPNPSPLTEPVATMLGACKVAGFSENLYVAAMATDGWSRQSGYDASAVRAFVLGPVGFTH